VAAGDRRQRGSHAPARRRAPGRLDAPRGGGGSPRPAEASDPLALAIAGERRGELLAALSALGSRDREVLSLRYLLDMSEQEMALALGCRRGTVKSRLSRALGRLRGEMTP